MPFLSTVSVDFSMAIAPSALGILDLKGGMAPPQVPRQEKIMLLPSKSLLKISSGEFSKGPAIQGGGGL